MNASIDKKAIEALIKNAKGYDGLPGTGKTQKLI